MKGNGNCPFEGFVREDALIDSGTEEAIATLIAKMSMDGLKDILDDMPKEQLREMAELGKRDFYCSLL